MSNLNRNLTVLLHMKEYCEQIDKAFEIFGKSFAHGYIERIKYLL